MLCTLLNVNLRVIIKGGNDHQYYFIIFFKECGTYDNKTKLPHIS